MQVFSFNLQWGLYLITILKLFEKVAWTVSYLNASLISQFA